MLKRISDNWWMIEFHPGENKLVWFGYTEAEVRGKFAAWMRKMDMKSQLHLIEN